MPWNYTQDEWLVTPDLFPLGEGPYQVTFWNQGNPDYASLATLHVHYSCDGGTTVTELYAFPSTGEDTAWTWYENTFGFDCP